MKITFRSENGSCPKWEHDGTEYYLLEDYDGTWSLMSQKIGFWEKNRFYGKGRKHIYPEALLARFFKGKKNVRFERNMNTSFWIWNGKRFATDGEKIAIMYEKEYERPSFGTYLECLKDAKKYLSEKYNDGQLSLFD